MKAYKIVSKLKEYTQVREKKITKIEKKDENRKCTKSPCQMQNLFFFCLVLTKNFLVNLSLSVVGSERAH